MLLRVVKRKSTLTPCLVNTKLVAVFRSLVLRCLPLNNILYFFGVNWVSKECRLHKNKPLLFPKLRNSFQIKNTGQQSEGAKYFVGDCCKFVILDGDTQKQRAD